MQRPVPQEIARRAYELWEHGGRIHGQDQQHWFRAERELIGAATAAEDRPIGEIRSAEQASPPPANPGAPRTPAPAAQPAPTAAATTAAEDRPIGEIRQAKQANTERAAPPESDPLIKASRQGKDEPEDLAAQIAELQRLMTKGKTASKPAPKPRARKTVGEVGTPASRDRKEPSPK